MSVRVAETPWEKEERLRLANAVAESGLAGQPLRRRPRLVRPTVETYAAASGGPLAYMVRLRQIETWTDVHDERLREAWRSLAAECDGDVGGFARRWRETVTRWDFAEVNELIERHNRYYPAEARLPMDPRTGDFAPVDGRSYRRPFLGAGWALARFPAVLALARADDAG